MLLLSGLVSGLVGVPVRGQTPAGITVSPTGRYVYVDTHINPSAGTLVVLKRDSTRVAELSGWLLGFVAGDVALYHRSQVHLAPTHSLELWTFDPATGRDARLYPNPTREDGSPVDSRLVDSVAINRVRRMATFRVEIGEGEVVVTCRGVGSVTSRCTQTAVAPSMEKLVGARARFQTTTRRVWRYGMLNRTRTEPGCFVVLLFGPNRQYIGQVPIDSMPALQVSSVYDASRDFEPADTATHAGERWIDVARTDVDRAVTRCHSRAR